MVGYPESSQRTLLQDAAYASFYSTPFAPAPGALASYQSTSPYSPASATPADELQNALESHSLARTGFRGVQVQTMPERRTSFTGVPEQFHQLSPRGGGGGSDMYSPGAPARFPAVGGSPASYPTAHAHPHQHSHHQHAHNHGHSFALGSPTSPYPHLSPEGASLLDMHSPPPPPPPRAPYAIPLRRDSLDSVSASASASVSVPDPISPSSVPGLVFDEGDYDDDSESSLPSAASDVHAQRLPYRSAHAHGHAHVSEEREFADGGAWGRASVSASADGSGSGSGGGAYVGLDDAARRHSHSHGHGHGARSPDPAGDAEHSPVTPSEGGQERARPAQKKSKMHQCTICLKLFPRPSGLATHMNSHSGAKREWLLTFMEGKNGESDMPVVVVFFASLQRSSARYRRARRASRCGRTRSGTCARTGSSRRLSTGARRPHNSRSGSTRLWCRRCTRRASCRRSCGGCRRACRRGRTSTTCAGTRRATRRTSTTRRRARCCRCRSRP